MKNEVYLQEMITEKSIQIPKTDINICLIGKTALKKNKILVACNGPVQDTLASHKEKKFTHLLVYPVLVYFY